MQRRLDKFVRLIRDSLRGSTQVGKDVLGNIYLVDKLDVEPKQQRRWVKWTDEILRKDSYPNPNNLPPEWLSWINRQRRDPPSEEEHLLLVKQRAEMKRKIASSRSTTSGDSTR